jgi:hypothetical protein
VRAIAVVVTLIAVGCARDVIREEGSVTAHEQLAWRDCRAGELDQLTAAFATYCRQQQDHRCAAPRGDHMDCQVVTRADGTRGRVVVREWCGALWRIDGAGWQAGEPITTIEFHSDCD